MAHVVPVLQEDPEAVVLPNLPEKTTGQNHKGASLGAMHQSRQQAAVRSVVLQPPASRLLNTAPDVLKHKPGPIKPGHQFLH
jgi:hypothetical protein